MAGNQRDVYADGEHVVVAGDRLTVAEVDALRRLLAEAALDAGRTAIARRQREEREAALARLAAVGPAHSPGVHVAPDGTLWALRGFGPPRPHVVGWDAGARWVTAGGRVAHTAVGGEGPPTCSRCGAEGWGPDPAPEGMRDCKARRRTP